MEEPGLGPVLCVSLAQGATAQGLGGSRATGGGELLQGLSQGWMELAELGWSFGGVWVRFGWDFMGLDEIWVGFDRFG